MNNNAMFQEIISAASVAYSSINNIMSAASAYSQACSDYEVAKIKANYDKQIEAAGNNSAKREKLEKERDKKINEAKNKANKKAMAIEIAQALASTAMNAISAYGAVLQPEQPWTVPLAIAAAVAATASGMLQVATIKNSTRQRLPAIMKAVLLDLVTIGARLVSYMLENLLQITKLSTTLSCYLHCS